RVCALARSLARQCIRAPSGALLSATGQLGRVLLLDNPRSDGFDHAFADDRLSVDLTHVFNGPAHHFRLLFVTRMPFATGYQRSAMKLLHHSIPPSIGCPNHTRYLGGGRPETRSRFVISRC